MNTYHVSVRIKIYIVDHLLYQGYSFLKYITLIYVFCTFICDVTKPLVGLVFSCCTETLFQRFQMVKQKTLFQRFVGGETWGETTLAHSFPKVSWDPFPKVMAEGLVPFPKPGTSCAGGVVPFPKPLCLAWSVPFPKHLYNSK